VKIFHSFPVEISLQKFTEIVRLTVLAAAFLVRSVAFFHAVISRIHKWFVYFWVSGCHCRQWWALVNWKSYKQKS